MPSALGFAAVPTLRSVLPALCLWLASLGCRDASPPAARVSPGDTLFSSLEELAVASWPESNLPEAARVPAAQLLRSPELTIQPEEWHDAGPAPDRPGENVWGVRPRMRLDLELGRPWLEHDGRACRPRSFTPRLRFQPGDTTGWTDPESAQFFGWDRGRGALLTVAPGRPRSVRIGYALEGTALGRQLEPVLRDGHAPADARALVRRATLQNVDRPALLVGTPARLVTEVDLGAVDELRFAVALWDIGFAWKKEQLVRVPSASDGVGFRVRAGIEGTPDELLWSLEISEKDRYHDASIDLARFRGQRVKLTFETDSGPDGDANSDYALWSGLSFHGPSGGAPASPHILLIDVDTLRADRLGCYGHTRDTSPRIDRWASREAVVYEDSLATANWTLPSTVSMLTGLAVTQHEVRFSRRVMGPELEPIAARLHAAGYQTLGRTDGGILSAAFGFALGFERFDARRLSRDEHERIGWGPELELIRGRKSERPLFFFLQTYQVHEPYVLDRRYDDPARPYQGRFAQQNALQTQLESGPAPDEADWRWLNDTYDAGVRRMDDVVGAFLEGLDEAFDGEPYLVILTSDHGDELGERGRFGHAHSLHTELLRVPLIVRYPDGPRGERETRPVSGLDLVPTMLAVAGLEAPAHLPGRSLLAELPARRLRLSEHAGEAFATDFDGWKLFTGTISGYGGPSHFPRLVRASDDPLEKLDVQDPERARALEELLQGFLAQYPPRSSTGPADGVFDDALVEELRELGYVGEED